MAALSPASSTFTRETADPLTQAGGAQCDVGTETHRILGKEGREKRHLRGCLVSSFGFHLVSACFCWSLTKWCTLYDDLQVKHHFVLKIQLFHSNNCVFCTSRMSVRALFVEMERPDPRIEMNMHVNMFSHFFQVCPLRTIPVFKLYEYCPIGVAKGVIRGVICSGARTAQVSTKKWLHKTVEQWARTNMSVATRAVVFQLQRTPSFHY